MIMSGRNKKTRLRKKIKARSDRPQLKVYRSNRHLYGQIIEPEKGNVLVAASDFDLNSKLVKSKKESTGLAVARAIGRLIAQRAVKKKIKKVVFDRSPYHYHGQIKSLAEGAREKGLNF